MKPITTHANYRAALEEIESLMTAKPNTAEGDRLDVLATLVEAYERAQRFGTPAESLIQQGAAKPS